MLLSGLRLGGAGPGGRGYKNRTDKGFLLSQQGFSLQPGFKLAEEMIVLGLGWNCKSRACCSVRSPSVWGLDRVLAHVEQSPNEPLSCSLPAVITLWPWKLLSAGDYKAPTALFKNKNTFAYKPERRHKTGVETSYIEWHR